MRVFVSGALFALVLLLGNASAQENRVDLSGALIGQIPIEGFAESAGRGFGGLAILEGGTYPGWAFSIRSGYIQYSERSNTERNHIPLMMGIKYILPDNSFYLSGEGGYVFTEIEAPALLGGKETTNEVNPAWGVGIGTMLGLLDVRLALNIWDAANMQESMAVGIIWGVRLQSY